MTKKRPVVAFYGKVRIPTIGHRKAIDVAKNLAKKVGGDLKVALSGAAKPLSVATKKSLAEKMFGVPVEVGDEMTKNLFTFLDHLNKDHDEIYLVAGSDRALEYKSMFEKYNGKKASDGKMLFNFKKWSVQEVQGERIDSDKHPTKMTKTELERTVSASRIESLAKDGDYAAVKAYYPGFSNTEIKGLYDSIRSGQANKEPKSVKTLKEEIHHKTFGPMLDSFVKFASNTIGLKDTPKITIEKDPMPNSFGGYNPESKAIHVVSKNRHPMDIFRTVAHELIHHKQNEDGRIGQDVAKEGSTGSKIENEANAEAGRIMRLFAKENPDTFMAKYVAESILDEGINDPAKAKAVFMAGGPGSGKDWVMSRTMDGHGMTEINSDSAFEHLMKMRNLDPMMPRHQEHSRDVARGDAKKMTKEKERLALAGRRGVIINGTADDPEKIKTIKKHLEDLGYETKMLFVNTNNEVSRQRNIERGLNGGRKVPDGTNKHGVPDGSRDIRGEKWQSAQDAKDHLKKVFGDEHFIHVDNSDDYRKVDPNKKKEIDKQHTQIFKHIRQFVSTPSKSSAAKEWTKKEQEKRGIKKFSEPKSIAVSTKKAVRPYVPNASELEQAKRLGVQHLGDGHFGKGKNAEPTHTSKAGQLVMREEDGCWKKYKRIGVKKKNGKTVPNCVPIDESFEKFIKENNDVSKREWGTTSLAQLYAQSTPGQENIIMQQDDGSIGYLTFDGLHKTVEKWVNDDKTKSRFIQKYGKDNAKTKLMESAQKINKLIPFMRESLDSKSGWDMGTVPKSLPEDWQKINRKDKTDGLSKKAVKAYRRENPGSKLQTAVTEKNPEGKRAARRKSFCSRMGGMKKKLTSSETARDPDSNINKALRRWNCN